MMELLNKQVKQLNNSLVHGTLVRSFAAVRDQGAVENLVIMLLLSNCSTIQDLKVFKNIVQLQGS